MTERLRGKTEPRVWTKPAGELTPQTSLGFECIQFAEEVVGIRLYEWQKWLLVHALELLEDGTFRFRKVFVLVGRQNGKSTLLQVLTLWRLYLDNGRLVLGTAQDRGIAREQWLGAVDMAQGVPELASLVADGSPSLSRGFEHFALASGEQYKVAASNRRAGRGLSVDLLLLDELREHQSWDAWSAVSKTTNARPKGQIWAVSNAGDASSIVLRHFRQMAHEALGDPDGLTRDPVSGDLRLTEVPDDMIEEDDSIGIFEWSAEPGVSVWDRDAWAQSNPSLGYGAMTERTLASDARNDPEWVYRTEVLCQWFDGAGEGPFPPGSWLVGLDNESVIADDSPLAACVDVSWDRSTAHIVYAGYRPDGKIHVSHVARRYGTEWVVPWLVSPERTRRPDVLVWQGNGAPVSSMKDELLGTAINPIELSGSDLGRACGEFYDLVRNVVDDTGAILEGRCAVYHNSQPSLDIAVNTAVTKPLGDSWVWDRAKSPSDISPLVGATGAVRGLLSLKSKVRSVYEDHALMVVD